MHGTLGVSGFSNRQQGAKDPIEYIWASTWTSLKPGTKDTALVWRDMQFHLAGFPTILAIQTMQHSVIGRSLAIC